MAELDSLIREALGSDYEEEWDSLGTVLVILLIEKRYGIRIESQDWPQLRSRNALAAYLIKRMEHDDSSL